MATIRLVPSAYSVSNSSYLSVSSASNMYNNTDNDTYATVTNSRSSTSSYYFYLKGFNFDDVPSDATINSFTVRIKIRESGVTTSSSYRMYLCNGTSTLSDYASTMPSTSVNTITFTVSSSWETLKSYGSDLAIRVNCRRSSRNTTAYLYVYGAEIEVDYTPSVTYTITSTITNGTILSDNPMTVSEGDDAVIQFNGDDGYSLKSMTVNGAPVTPIYNKTGEAAADITVSYSTNYGTYSSYSFDNCHDDNTSSWFWSSEAQASGKYVLIEFSEPVDLSSFSTYSSSSTDMPNSVNYLQVSTDGSTWTDVGQFSGEATCTFSNIGAKGIIAVRIYAKSDVNYWLVLNEITMSYSAAVTSDYTYTISNVTEDQTVVIVFAKDTENTAYIKLSTGWTLAKKVYVKGSSGWSEATWDDLQTIFETENVR